MKLSILPSSTASASFSSYFAYLTVEIIGVLGCMYFDEVQHKAYHKFYLICEAVLFSQLVLNAVLHVSGVMEFYRTVMISHGLSCFVGVIAIVGLIRDMISKKVKEYQITAAGMAFFILCALGEMYGFFFVKSFQFGAYIGIGLVILLTATVIQDVVDSGRERAHHEQVQTQMTIGTSKPSLAQLMPETSTRAVTPKESVFMRRNSQEKWRRITIFPKKTSFALSTSASCTTSEKSVWRTRY